MTCFRRLNHNGIYHGFSNIQLLHLILQWTAVFEIYPATGTSYLEKAAGSLSDKEGLPMTSLDQNSKIEITAEMLKRLLDYSSDEIFIFNNERQIIYANSICERNYGLKKEDLIGKLNTELFE